jgi:catechol 2,3-dioxygenase-like lactoylglutathione lyase family enzyme
MSHRIDGAKIKLNQWIKPASMGVPYPAPLTHLGLHRINWASTDVEADMALLKSHGIKFLSPIAPCCEGAASTFGFAIFEDPDGIYNQIMGTIKPSVLSEGQ